MKRSDTAVTEVIGYVLSFAVSAIFLLIALNIFYTARTNTDNVVQGVELKTLADKVSSHLVSAGLVAQEFPNASVDEQFDIPQSLDGRDYNITAAADHVTVATVDGGLSATGTTLKLDKTGILVSGTVISTQEHITISYRLVGATQEIDIH